MFCIHHPPAGGQELPTGRWLYPVISLLGRAEAIWPTVLDDRLLLRAPTPAAVETVKGPRQRIAAAASPSRKLQKASW